MTEVEKQSPASVSKDTVDFLDLLIKAMTGVPVSEIPAEKRQDVVEKCIKIFSDYIINYVEIKFSKKDAVRLKAAQQSNENMFNKFKYLGPKFDEAYHSFLDNLEKSWEEQIEKIKKTDQSKES